MTGITSIGKTTNLRRAAEEAAAGLRRAIETAAAKASDLNGPVLAWSSTRMPEIEVLDLFARAAALAQPRTLWMRPDAGFSILAIGSVWAHVSDGPARFRDAGRAWRALNRAAVGEFDLSAPVAMAGFAFAPHRTLGSEWEGFPSGVLTLPALTVRQTRAGAILTLASVVSPRAAVSGQGELVLTWLRIAADAMARNGDGGGVIERDTTPGREALRIADARPDATRWKAEVADAARAVRSGALRKVVLARQVKVEGVRAAETEVIDRLREEYPGCAVFAVARGDRCFLGATPELLVRVEGGTVMTGALAGSAPRGATEDEDRRFGNALLASTKDRLEHAVVVEDLRQTIDQVCTEVSVASPPTLLRVANVQHLFTPITGRLQNHLCILDLVERLHPSPAVGGLPREAALAWVSRHEGFDRGWYAGPIGWIGHDGEGEFSVAIRSALLRGREALLFAGCGIMADSDPDMEYKESQLKLRSMLSALGGGSVPDLVDV
jgi:isochorismate synthase